MKRPSAESNTGVNLMGNPAPLMSYVPQGAEDDPRYQAMLGFVKWAREWSRFNNQIIRDKTTKLLKEIGELE